jgi:hypothetical protein
MTVRRPTLLRCNVCLGHSRQSWYVRIIWVTGNLGNAVVRSPMKASSLGSPDGQIIKRFERATARLANPTHEKRCAKERTSSPGRARHKPSNRCAGKAGCSPLDLYARVRTSLCSLHTGPRVQRAPGLPCALSCQSGQAARHNSGASRRENTPAYPPVGLIRFPPIIIPT